MEQGQDQKISENDNFDYEEEQSLVSIVLKNGLKILLGLIVVVAIIIGIIFSVRLFTNNKPSTTKTATTTTAPTNKAATTFPRSTTTQQRTAQSSYKDTTYNYSLQLPVGWEAFKRTELNGAYQTGLRPVGSTDVPMVINTQPNPQNLTIQNVIASAFGEDYPYENKTIGGQNAAMVTDPTGTIQSYFIANSRGIYEIALTKQNPNYTPTLSSILSSLKITR